MPSGEFTKNVSNGTSLSMPKLLRTVGSAVRDILYVPPPSAQYLERTRHSTVVPWHERLWGASPWQRRVRNSIVVLAVLVLGGSAAGVLYTRSLDAQERRFAAGVAAMRAADYKSAKTILQRTTLADPTNARAFYELGNAHWMLGEGPEAAAAWSGALRIDPEMAAAYIARGIQKFNMGEIEASLQDFQKAVAVKPSMEAYLQQGMALQKLGRHHEAVASFDEARTFASDDDEKEIEVASKTSRLAVRKERKKR